jgi:hypothetical protein
MTILSGFTGFKAITGLCRPHNVFYKQWLFNFHLPLSGTVAAVDVGVRAPV